MPRFGKIVVIKRNGTDGTHFPLTVNSCTFGRRKECDIRIQLPQVSKEHCRIEVNENKEAILVNLSTVNPTQLNGSDFQQPVYLKHGDVLTVIDRSFRFEYPPAPLARKRSSRSEEKETLQVLQVQQVEQENLHPQNSEYKIHISDEKLEWEGEKASGNDEQRAQEDTTRENGTNESMYKIRRSGRKNMSFSVPYEFMKHEVDTKPSETHFNSKIAIQQKEYLPRKDSIGIAASRTLCRISPSEQAVQTEVTETVTLENVKLPTDTEKQGIISNPMFVEENSTRRSSRVLQTYPAKDRQECEEANFQNVGENELENFEVIKSSDEANGQSSECLSTSYCTVALEYTDETSHPKRSVTPSTETANGEVKTNLRNSFGSVESVLSRPKAEGESVEIYSFPCLRQASGMQHTDLDPSLGLKSTAEITSEIQDIMPVTTREYESDVLMENRLKNRRNTLLVTEHPLDAQILEETKMESNVLKDGHLETIACLVHHSNNKSPRRSTRQRRDFSSAGSFTQKITMEESLVTARDMSPFKGTIEENVKCWHQENVSNIEEKPSSKSLEDSFVMKYTAKCSCLSESRHESPVQMPAEKDIISEMNVSSQCSKNQGSVQKSPQKRKGGELDFSVQPLGKRKRVSFGGHLSPELFDKHLPPNSPLKKGAIPARFSLPFGNSPRAVLKKASGFSQRTVKGFSGKNQQTTLPKTEPLAASPPARRSPAASSPARRSPAASSPARRSPAASSPARRSPAASSPARRSPAASSPARRSPAASSPARRSPAASSPARRSPAASSPARRSPAASSPARRSPAASSPARRSPAASSPARRSPAASSPARRSPAASSPARRSPAASPPARRSPAASPPARRSPAASPPARRSPAASPHIRGRFSISRVNVSSVSSEEQIALAGQMNINKEKNTPEPSRQESQTVQSVRRSKKFIRKRTSLGRRSSAVDAIRTKRQSGASEANLIVSRSWAEVVKQGVPKSQQKSTSKCDFKGRPAKKMPSKASKNIVSLKAPTRRIKGYFPTGHANSPAPIVVGKVHTSIVNVTAQVPKVMFNYTLKKQQDTNESFTGMTEMFHTPLNWKHGISLSSVQKSGMSPPGEVLEIHTPEESGKMEVSPSDLSILDTCDEQDVESFIWRKVSQISVPGQDEVKIPTGENSAFSEIVGRNSSLVKNETVETEEITKDPKQILGSNEVLSGVKRLMKTPKQKPQPVEALSGVKRLMRTPKQKPQPVEALSGVKRLMRTPKQKPQPVEALSGVKRLMRTPKQKPQPVEALSGVKRLMRTPKQKPQPVEALSGVKRLMRTPKQKPQPVEALSGVKRLMRTPKQKPQPVEALSGVKRLMRTPKQKPQPVEALSGVKRLMKTPKQKPQPAEALSGVKRLVETPKHKIDTVEEHICSKHLNSPEEAEAPKKKIHILADTEESQRLRTPKQKFEPVEDMIGISRILKTPRQKFMPVDDYLGLQRLMVEPKLNSLSVEIDYTGIQELFSPVDGCLVPLTESVDEPHENSSHGFGCRGDMPKREQPQQETSLEDSFERKSPVVMLRRPDDGHDELEDYLEHISCSSLNGLAGADLEDIATVSCVPETYESDGMDLQNGAMIDLIKESSTRQGAPVEINEPLASTEKTRIENTKSSFTEEHDKSRTQRQTRNSNRAKLANCMQTNENCDCKVTEISPPEDSESSPTEFETEITETLRESSRKHSIETNGNMDFDNIRHTQELLELSKEMSIKMQLSVNRRRMAAKPNKQAEANLHLEENASAKKPATQLISKTSVRPKNQKKNEPNSEFTKLNPQEKMQSLNLESSKRKSVNQLLKNSSRRKATPVETEMEAINMTLDSERNTSRKKRKLETLGNHPTEVKEGTTRRGKGRKLHFQKGTLDKSFQDTPDEGNSKDAQKVPSNNTEASAEHILPKRQKVTRGNLPRRGRSKQVGSDEHLTESENREIPDFENQGMFVENTLSTKEDQPKRGRGRKVARISQTQGNLTVPEEDQSTGNSGLAQEKSFQDTSDEENSKEAEKVPSNNTEASAEHILPKRQKVARGNLPRRGRSKQVGSDEHPTESENRETADFEKQDMVVENTLSAKEDQPKRGRGRKVTPISQTQGNLIVPEEDPSTGNSGLAQEKSFQDTSDEENSKEAKKVPSNNTEASAEHILPKRQKVTRGNLPRRGRSKQVGSDEHPTESENRETPDFENQGMLVENTLSAKEDQPKRGRGIKVAPVSQTQGNLTVPEEDPSTGNSGLAQEKSFQDTSDEENSKEAEKVPSNNTEASAEHILPKRQKVTRGNLPRRGRSKQVDSDEHPTESENRETPDFENQGMLVENTLSAKEDQPKRGRGRKVAPISQTQGNLTVPEEDPSTGNSGLASNNTKASAEHILPKRQKVTRGNLPRRGRSKQVGSDEHSTESENRETPCKTQNTVVENTFSAKADQPKRGRGRKFVPISQTPGNLTVPEEDPSTGTSSFTQEKCLQDTPDEENSKEADKVPSSNTKASAKHILPKRQKVTRGNLPRRGRSKQVGSDEHSAENENRESPDFENQDMVVKNTFSAKEDQPKIGGVKTQGNLTVPEEDPSTGNSGLAQEKSFQDTPDEENSKEAENVPLNNTEVSAEHILPKRQKVTRGNALRRGRRKQVGSDEPTENENRETPVVENQDMVVEHTFFVKEDQPKRGRRRKDAPISQTRGNLTVPEEDPSTGSSSLAREKSFQDTSDEENSKEAQKVVPLDNTETSTEHILPKSKKVARGNLLQRGRSKQVISDEQHTENKNTEISDAENEDMVVKNAFTVKRNQPKRVRELKVTFVTPKLCPLVESDNFLLSNKDKNAAEEQNEGLEMATTANENQSSRGRNRKRENTLASSSISASKKPRVVNNANQKEMANVLKGVTKEIVSKRCRRKPPAYKAPIESKSQQRDTGNPVKPIKEKTMPADSLSENQSKRGRGGKIVLALQTPSSPALKISITLPSSLSDQNKSANENQNFLIENNDAGKENLAISGRKNEEMVSRSTCIRRKCNSPEDECQEKQNPNLEKIGISNSKQTRRRLRKGDDSETTLFKGKYGVPEGHDAISKSRQVMLANTVSGMEDASRGRRKRILKGKKILEHSDQKNDLEITLSRGKENPSKQGRQKQVSSEPEMHVTTSGVKKYFLEENKSVPETENTGSTSQRGRRKEMNEECASSTTESAVETQSMTKASRRTRKQVL